MSEQIGNKINDKTYIPLPPFKGWVLENFPFIEADFDCITNYQLLCKVIEYLNNVISNQNTVQELGTDLVNAYNSLVVAVNLAIGEFEDSVTNDFNALHDYVYNYFDNLDVQEEINNKLDAMVQAGTLQEIVADYLNSKAIFGFDNVSSMVSSTNLINGSYAQTMGYYSKNDGGSGLYKIRTITNDDIIDDGSIIEMEDDNLVAELIVPNYEINVNQFGAKGDGITNDHDAIVSALNFIYAKTQIASDNDMKTYYTLSFCNKVYLNSSVIAYNNIIDNLIIKGNGAVIYGYGFNFGTNVGLNLLVDNLNFKGVNKCFEFDYIDRNYQTLVFQNCYFRFCENVFVINRRSCSVKFDNCKFNNMEKAMYLNNVDKVEISNCWFQTSNTSVSDYHGVIEQTGNEEGWIDVHDCLFIPQLTGNYISWFKINQKITCHHNRFSGESPNYLNVIYTTNKMDTPTSTNQRYVVDIHDNPIMETPCIVVLNGIPELLNMSNNGGRKNGGKLIIWDGALTSEQQKTKLLAKISSFHLTFSSNGFRNFDLLSGDIDQPSALLPAIPENLYTFVQRKYRGQQHQIQYMVESHTKSGTVTNELQIKLFDLSSYLKRNNTGLTFIIVYRGNTDGYYNAENMINMVTLNQETNSSTLKISESTIMGSRTGDYTLTFEGGSTSVDTSVTPNPILVLTKVAGRSVNYLQIMPLQTDDILSFGQL